MHLRSEPTNLVDETTVCSNSDQGYVVMLAAADENAELIAWAKPLMAAMEAKAMRATMSAYSVRS